MIKDQNTVVQDAPPRIDQLAQLEELLSRPTPFVADALSGSDGDILVLGVAGKMGPTLARMAKRASRARVIGVARFTNPLERQKLESHGIETIRADLLDERQLAALPDCPNVIYMAGMKFGATGNEGLTWAMNCFLPGLVCKRFARSRIVAFSTGNVYGLSPAAAAGSREDAALNPVGDYAMSCLGRERIFDHFSRSMKIPVSIIRLFYATELRYGVLLDIATKVQKCEPIDVSMGHLNAIWQRDANAQSLASLSLASSPPFILNVAGPDVLRVRQIATEFGKLLGKEPVIVGTEAPDALLGNSDLAQRLYGRPSVSHPVLMRWIADWVGRGGTTFDKPTHFEERGGKF